MGLLYGVQKGSGSSYETLHKQLADSGDLVFDLSLPVKANKDGRLVLHGPLVQDRQPNGIDAIVSPIRYPDQ
ncbi:hypothetical protein BN8_01966 [Fibrisoma limi BUZ 3]|uniref:Uncharacterized protein n=1 Tax=Fibrisoma limi BUZ 3 TaxID=1185876 RepID=I2GG97_9BACT|nr:hypothetical protein BN8_01966 [Fibrisoma limi BUZ 3]